MTPVLPQHDPARAERTAELARRRDVFQYTYDWPRGVARAAAVPAPENYTLAYASHLLPIAARLVENALGFAASEAERAAVVLLRDAIAHTLPAASVADAVAFVRGLPAALAAAVDRPVASVDTYREMFRSIPEPPLVERWRDDASFVWQRLAGTNPMSLCRAKALPDGVDDATWGRAGLSGSLAEAVAAGRVFVVDHRGLAGAATGVFMGREKRLPAPLAVFGAEGGALRPVAIVEAGVTCTPGEAGWLAAKFAVQVADANVHETVIHLGRTHMVMEAAAMALQRALSSRHPLFVLLHPHTAFTLPINQSAATDLIAAGGVIDEVFAGTIEASAGLVAPGIASWPLAASAPPDEIAARGCDDPAIIAVYPYRDDALPLWAAIEAFVAEYVALVYPTEADVAADDELAAFAAELAGPGRLAGVDPPADRAGVTRLVATLIWTASAQHAAVNFTQFPTMGFAANTAGALWADRPAERFEALTPPLRAAFLQFNNVYQVSNLRVNHLGGYPIGHFADRRARAIVDRFQSALHQVEQATIRRDQGRLFSYPYLRPSQVPNSIHI